MLKEFIIRYLKHCTKVWTEQFIRYCSQKETCTIEEMDEFKKWFNKNKRV